LEQKREMVADGSGAKIVKSSGEKEIFDPNVITSDCVEAGVEFWTAAEVALEVSKGIFDGINSDEIQRKILRALYERNPEIAERYKRFHSMFVRSSSNTIERFDRKRIVDSLVLETSLPKEVAEIVAKETEGELRRLNLDFTSGPLIREIVNVKLLEHGYESARSDYTRLGMPVYDAAQVIEASLRGVARPENPEAVHRAMANSIFREYSLLKVLPLHLADAHMKGDLHVHGLEYFVTRPYTAVHDLRSILKSGLDFRGLRQVYPVAGPAKNATTAVLQALKSLMAYSASFYSNQGLHFFNVWLAPYLAEMGREKIGQLAQTCLFEISQTAQLSGLGSPPVDLEIEYGVPEIVSQVPAVLPGGRVEEGLLYSDFEEEAREFARALTEVYLKGDYLGSSLNSPRLIYKLRKENEHKEGYEDFMLQLHKGAAGRREINLLNLSTSHLNQLTSAHSSGIYYQTDKKNFDLSKTHTYSGLQCVTINLPRVAYKAGGREERVFERLDESIALAREILQVKREVITRRFKQSAPSELEGFSNLVGFSGLNEALKTYLGEELHESGYAREMGVSIVRHMSQSLKELGNNTGVDWLLTSMDSPLTAQRFAALDAGQFSEAVMALDDKNLMNLGYTDSCHVSDQAGLEPLKRQKIEGPFHSLSNGGMMQKIVVKNEEADELLLLSKELLKAASGYWSFVP
jgi:ribonucleoside-triphosphate reductase